jgi:hypothetical protein
VLIVKPAKAEHFSMSQVVAAKEAGVPKSVVDALVDRIYRPYRNPVTAAALYPDQRLMAIARTRMYKALVPMMEDNYFYPWDNNIELTSVHQAQNWIQRVIDEDGHIATATADYKKEQRKKHKAARVRKYAAMNSSAVSTTSDTDGSDSE